MSRIPAIAGLATVLLAAATPARADTPEALCGGRYAAAADMVDAAYRDYGTLYSGGEHWRTLDDVGATLDLYRLWNGLDDLELRKRRFEYASYRDDPIYEAMSRRAIHELAPRVLAVIDAPAGEPVSEEDRYVAATAADLLTTLGPEPGWWLREGPDAGLTPGEERTRALAQNEASIAWLQTVLAASDAPWAYGWYLEVAPVSAAYRQYHALAGHAFERFDSGDGVAWLIAGAMLTPDSPLGRDRFAQVETWAAKIDACDATPAEYAAHAMLRLEQLRISGGLEAGDRARLPGEVYALAYRQEAWGAFFDPSDGERRAGRLRDLLPDRDMLPWLNVSRTYRADSIEALIAVHDGAELAPKTLRALNALSVANLLRFAEAPGRHPDERRELLKVAFCRLVALKRLDEAEALVPDLVAVFPEQAARMQAVAERRWAQDVRMALIALELPGMSVWLTEIPGQWPHSDDSALWLRTATKYGVDLPYEMRTGAFLQRDLEVWLRLPERWRAFSTMRGYTIGMVTRAHARDRAPTVAANAPHFLPDRPGIREAQPFADLIAWDEIAQLGPRTGLSRQIGVSLIGWAEDRSGNRLLRAFAPREEIAASLKAVIDLYRRNDMGQIDGAPLGQRAFELLHTRFGQTEAAASTPYWYECSQACER